MRNVCTTGRRWAGHAAGALLAAALLASPRPVAAAIHVVTDLGDTGAAGQLRTIVTAAADGDTILVPPGTIVLTLAAGGDIDVNADLTILGAGRDLTVLDGGGIDRVIEVSVGHEVVIGALTARNGYVAVGTGGAIENFGALTLVDVVVEDSSSEAGGGICNRQFATMTLQTVTVRRNSTFGTTPIGGGIFNSGEMTISHSTISGNTTTGTSGSANGGGVGNAAELTVINSTISGNVAAANQAGGLFHAASGTLLVLENVTIADNRAIQGGAGAVGGLSIMGDNASAVNTLIARNRTGPGDTAPDCGGTLDSGGYNLIGNAAHCTIVGTLTGNIVGRNPWLLPLFDYGGPTETMALMPWSPALDAGSPADCPTTDQRGRPRPADGNRDGVATCDIGAFELERR